jgi:anti-sigma28 factor (negative regulator of flagellin synthesis)
MLNRVERITATANPARRTGRLPVFQREDTNGSQRPTSIETVDVAHITALLAAIVEAAGIVPAIDNARIASLRQAIASDTLRINSQLIAQSAIELDATLS